MNGEAAEEMLRHFERAAAEHAGWLKWLHCVLLFGDNPAPDIAPWPSPREVPEPPREIAADQLTATTAEARQSRQGFARMRRSHGAMKDLAQDLLLRKAQGKPLSPAQYVAFMNAFETYSRDVRALECRLRQALAETDPLTGVLNRQGMMRDLGREWIRASRTLSPSCIAIADLDHFKAVNDEFGHRAGDLVLKETARFFVRRLRPYDLVYRYGGEEFLFCLPDTGLEDASRILDRLRRSLGRQSLRLDDGNRVSATVSIGVAEMDSNHGPQQAIVAADHALYRAKESGRNRVCAAEPEASNKTGGGARDACAPPMPAR